MKTVHSNFYDSNHTTKKSFRQFQNFAFIEQKEILQSSTRYDNLKLNYFLTVKKLERFTPKLSHIRSS